MAKICDWYRDNSCDCLCDGLNPNCENYSGDLKLENSEFEQNYPNINDIDISNTSIRLTCKDTNLRVLKARNMKEGSNINCVGCTNLDNVEINGVVESITIDAWSNNISIPVSGSLDCKSITIENRRFDHLTINITNAKTLETLIISNCENLNIGNCPKLKEIIFSDGGEGNPYYKVVKSLHLDIPPYSSARNYDVLKINHI